MSLGGLRRAKGIVFDFDGTLANSFPSIKRCFDYALRQVGSQPISEEELRKLIGVEPMEQILRLKVPEERIRECTEEYRKHYLSTFHLDTTLFKGATELLKTIRARGNAIGVLTLKNTSLTASILESFGLQDYVDVVVGGDLLPEGKSSQALLKVLKSLGAEPKQSVYVGDQWHDIRIAKEIGAYSVAVLHGLGTKQDLGREGPDLLLDNLQELIEVFGST